VADDVLRRLYRDAGAFVYPSVFEGFGLPVLEALAAGAPTVTSNVSSLPEVAGDAALLVDPRSATDIAAAVETILNDPRKAEELRDRGRARARQFTWERTASITRGVYDALAR
jgi:glycosyltransferase involved in cell wall biosynthesis